MIIPSTAWLFFPKQSAKRLTLAVGISSLRKVSILLVKQEIGCEDSFCLVPSLFSFIQRIGAVALFPYLLLGCSQLSEADSQK